MKKSIFALVMALVLCLSTAAMASEASFAFTAEEYVEGYTKFCNEALSTETTWSDAVALEDGLTGWLGSGEGMNDVCVLAMEGETGCYAIGCDLILSMTDADMTAKAQAFGMTVAAIPYATRYLENDYDTDALSKELSEIEQACTGLVQVVFSSDAITAAVTDGSYTETAVIGGHNATLTLSVDASTMEMSISFVYMP